MRDVILAVAQIVGECSKADRLQEMGIQIFSNALAEILPFGLVRNQRDRIEQVGEKDCKITF